MTVRTSKPAVNLREELASLRNQGGYQEQQFYFDGLVTNGTFDADVSGWADTSQAGGSIAWNASGAIDLITDASGNDGIAEQLISTVSGKTYVIDAQRISGSTQVLVTVLGTSPLLQFYVNEDQEAARTFIASSSHTLQLRNVDTNTTASIDSISVFETDGTDVVHRLPKGWKPKDVFEDGLLQREGAAHDYTVVYDGFDYFVKPAVAPSATTQTCVIGVKA